MCFALPPLTTAADAARAMAAVTAVVAEGTLMPSKAGELTRMVEVFTRTLEVADLEARITALEQRGARG